MLQTLKATAPYLSPELVLGTGASELHQVFSGADLAAVHGAYMTGIKDVFACGLAASAFAALLALVIPWKQKLPDHDSQKAGEKGATVSV